MHYIKLRLTSWPTAKMRFEQNIKVLKCIKCIVPLVMERLAVKLMSLKMHTQPKKLLISTECVTTVQKVLE